MERYEEVPNCFPEVIERALRKVFDAKDQYASQWAAIESIAAKILKRPTVVKARRPERAGNRVFARRP